jgi:hypothetical protein
MAMGSDPSNTREEINKLHFIFVFATALNKPLVVAFFCSLNVYCNDACRKNIRRNPRKCLNKVAFGGILAEVMYSAAAMGNAFKWVQGLWHIFFQS